MREGVKRTPSQRAARFPLVNDPAQQRVRGGGSPILERIGTQDGGEITIRVMGSRIPYSRELWEVAQTPLGRYDHDLSLQTGEHPLGWLFLSHALMALVWAELHWCASNDLHVAFCQGCDGLFVPRSHAKFCSPKCRRDHYEIENSSRQALQDLHQELTRFAKRAYAVEDVKAWMPTYMRKWKRYERQRRGNRRRAKKVHPAMVALSTPEGRRRLGRIREARQPRVERGYWRQKAEDERRDLMRWLQDVGVPRPPKAWMTNFSGHDR
jgi:hypothetical protein